MEYYYQVLEDIKINKTRFLCSQSSSPCRLFYKCYDVEICVLWFCFSHQLGCELLKSKGIFLIFFVFSVCAVPKEGITVGLQERRTNVPRPLSIMARASLRCFPTHRKAWHLQPRGTRWNEEPWEKSLTFFSWPQKSVFNLIFSFSGKNIKHGYLNLRLIRQTAITTSWQHQQQEHLLYIRSYFQNLTNVNFFNLNHKPMR